MHNPPFPQWTAAQSDAAFTDAKEISVRITEFDKKIRRRNMIEYIAGGMVIAAFGFSAWKAAVSDEWLVTGAIMVLIVGVLMVMLNLYRRASNIDRAPEADCRSHRRAQLVHQHRALSTVASWYIGPMVPGIALILLSTAAIVARETGWAIALAANIGPVAIVAAVFGGVIWLNKVAAKKLAQEIEKLDRLGAAA